MRAVLINRAGFHKHFHTAKKVPYYRQLGEENVNMFSLSERATEELKEFVPIIEFVFEREYEDEWGEKVLIYKEYGA